jgi:hypothetical protein
MTKMPKMMVGLLSWLFLVGCYNTNNVKNGGLVCGKADSCPDGFECRKDGLTQGQSGHCWRKGSAPDSGSVMGDAPAPGRDATVGPLCTSSTRGILGTPFENCNYSAPSNSSCDPVCQSGCACDRRCMLKDTFDGFSCEDSAAPQNLIRTNGVCDGSDSLRCEPGSVCVGDESCPWVCTKLCIKYEDCPKDSRCTRLTLVDLNRNPLTDVSLCSPPIENCNPTGKADCGTAKPRLNCYFLAGLTGVTNTDATVCDCSTQHTNGVGAKCSSAPDDCQAGAVCVEGTCRTICSKSSASSCPNGSPCNAIYGSTQYGYCR